MGDLAGLIDVASKITIISGLVLILWGGVTRKWVFGWLYDQCKTDLEARLAQTEKDRDEWKARALEQLGINKDTAESLKKLVGQAARSQLAGSKDKDTSGVGGGQ